MHSYSFAPWCWFAFTEKHYVGHDSAGIPIINSAEGRGVVDLYAAATQFLDTPTWITLGAALLISTTAFIVMLLYVRAVDPKSKPDNAMPQPGPVVEGGTSPLRRHVAATTAADDRSLGKYKPRSPVGLAGYHLPGRRLSSMPKPLSAVRHVSIPSAAPSPLPHPRACSFCLGATPSRPHHRRSRCQRVMPACFGPGLSLRS
jgi:hypothetical protein